MPRGQALPWFQARQPPVPSNQENSRSSLNDLGAMGFSGLIQCSPASSSPLLLASISATALSTAARTIGSSEVTGAGLVAIISTIGC